MEGSWLDELPDDFVEAEIVSRLEPAFSVLFHLVDKKRFRFLRIENIIPEYEYYYQILRTRRSELFIWFVESFGPFEDPQLFLSTLLYATVSMGDLESTLYLLSKIRYSELRNTYRVFSHRTGSIAPEPSFVESLRKIFLAHQTFESAKREVEVAIRNYFSFKSLSTIENLWKHEKSLGMATSSTPDFSRVIRLLTDLTFLRDSVQLRKFFRSFTSYYSLNEASKFLIWNLDIIQKLSDQIDVFGLLFKSYKASGNMTDLEADPFTALILASISQGNSLKNTLNLISLIEKSKIAKPIEEFIDEIAPNAFAAAVTSPSQHALSQTLFWRGKLPTDSNPFETLSLSNLFCASPIVLRHFCDEINTPRTRAALDMEPRDFIRNVGRMSAESLLIFLDEFQWKLPITIDLICNPMKDWKVTEILLDRTKLVTVFPQRAAYILFGNCDNKTIISVLSYVFKSRRNDLQYILKIAFETGRTWVVSYIEKTFGVLCRRRDYFELLGQSLSLCRYSMASMILNRLKTLQPKRLYRRGSNFIGHFIHNANVEHLEWLKANGFTFPPSIYYTLYRFGRYGRQPAMMRGGGFHPHIITDLHLNVFKWLCSNKIPLPDDETHRKVIIEWLRTSSNFSSDQYKDLRDYFNSNP